MRLLPLLGTIGLTVWLVSRLDTAALTATWAALPVGVALGAACLALSAELFIGPYKWGRVVRALGVDMTFADAVLIRLGSQPLRLVMPLKTGEGVVVGHLVRVRGMDVATATSTVLFEKVVNLWATVVLLSVGLALTEAAGGGWVGSAGLAWLLVALVVAAPGLRGPWRWLAAKVRTGGRVGAFLGRLLDAFVALPTRELWVQAPLALAFTSLEVVNSWWLLTVLGVEAPFSLVLLVIPLSYFLNNLPVTVAGIGMREALFVVAFAELATPATCFAAGVAVSTIAYVVPTLAGLLMMRRFLAVTAAGRA